MFRQQLEPAYLWNIRANTHEKSAKRATSAFHFPPSRRDARKAKSVLNAANLAIEQSTGAEASAYCGYHQEYAHPQLMARPVVTQKPTIHQSGTRFRIASRRGSSNGTRKRNAISAKRRKGMPHIGWASVCIVSSTIPAVKTIVSSGPIPTRRQCRNQQAIWRKLPLTHFERKQDVTTVEAGLKNLQGAMLLPWFRSLSRYWSRSQYFCCGLPF